jgi:iron(II)-dependent oxidoreductase
VTGLGTLTLLRAIQRRLLALVEPLADADCRRQYHEDLSPIGWHLGHSVFIENLWLRERVVGDARTTASLHDFYRPERIPRPQRGPGLPPVEDLLSEVREQQEANILLLTGVGESLPAHPLLEQEYLPRFLIQHHAQHYETMLMVLAQRAQQRHRGQFFPQRRLRAHGTPKDLVSVAGGAFPVGGQRPDAFDNELPAQDVHLRPFHIARRPVSNAEFLAFIEDDGYSGGAHWDEAGLAWLRASGAQHPEHWRRDARGWWYALGPAGPFELEPEGPVQGLSCYEAEAYARWAGARLPHENEWEVAARLLLIVDTGRAWEWCANAFFPYPGFEAFPYPEYSEAWFEGDHRTLKGGSIYTRREIRRAAFRNFYTPEKRHVFAGLRLAY